MNGTDKHTALDKVRNFLSCDYGTASVIAVFYLVGVFGHYSSITREFMLLLTPWFLLVAGLVVVVPYWRQTGGAGRLWVVATYLVTFSLEAIGVATGSVFGAYEYGTVLGFHLFEVPMIIGFNWVLVILGFLRGSQHLFIRSKVAERRSVRLAAGIASVAVPAAAALIFDYIMEPVAIRLDYWTWTDGYIPLRNYAAWFLIALGASTLFRLLRITFTSLLPLYYGVIQILFFLGLYLIL